MLRYFFFSSRRRHTRFDCDWSSDVCSSDLHDLDPLDLIDRQVGEIEGSQRRTLHPHAVDQDLHLGGTRPSDPDVRQLAETPGALNFETRHLTESVADGLVVIGLQIVLGDHAHCGTESLLGLFELRRSDDHGFERPWLLRCRRRKQCRERHHDDRCDTHSPHGFTPFPRKGFEASAPERSPDSWIFATVPPSHPCNTDSGSAERNGTVLPTYSGGTAPPPGLTQRRPPPPWPGDPPPRAGPLPPPPHPTPPRAR